MIQTGQKTIKIQEKTYNHLFVTNICIFDSYSDSSLFTAISHSVTVVPLAFNDDNKDWLGSKNSYC